MKAEVLRYNENFLCHELKLLGTMEQLGCSGFNSRYIRCDIYVSGNNRIPEKDIIGKFIEIEDIVPCLFIAGVVKEVTE